MTNAIITKKPLIIGSSEGLNGVLYFDKSADGDLDRIKQLKDKLIKDMGINDAYITKVEPVDGSNEGRSEYAIKFKGAKGFKDSFAFQKNLADDGFVTQAFIDKQKAEYDAVIKGDYENVGFPFNAIPKWARKKVFEAFPSPEQRYKLAVLAYGLGDIVGIINGLLVNKDPNELLYGAAAGVATAFGLKAEGRHEGLTQSGKILAELREKFTADGILQEYPDQFKAPQAENAMDAVNKFFEKNSHTGFWSLNLISGKALTEAGMGQGGVLGFFKFLSGLGLSFGQGLYLFSRTKGESAQGIDIAKAVEDSGVGQIADKIGVTKFLKENDAGKWISKKAEELHENPKGLASSLFKLHSLNMMFVVPVIAQFSAPLKNQEIKERYGEKPEEAGALIKILRPISKIGDVLISPIRILPWFRKKPKLPDVDSPDRFHVKDENGNVIKKWWDLNHEEAKQHVEALGKSNAVSAEEHRQFAEDVEKLHEAKRLRSGGIMNFIMSALYGAGNFVIGSSNSGQKADIVELFYESAQLIRDVNPKHAGQAIDQVANFLTNRPEVWQHKFLWDTKQEAFKGMTGKAFAEENGREAYLQRVKAVVALNLRDAYVGIEEINTPAKGVGFSDETQVSRPTQPVMQKMPEGVISPDLSRYFGSDNNHQIKFA